MLLQHLDWPDAMVNAVMGRAVELVKDSRASKKKPGTLEQFLQQYPLNSAEGRALMTLAEAFLRIPDAATRNALLKDRLNAAEWNSKEGADWFSKLTGAGLGLSKGTLNSLLGKLGEPLVRQGVATAMKSIGDQFVLGQTIETALGKAAKDMQSAYSFDMLGEGARTAADAQRYFESYAQAISAVGTAKLSKSAGISVKLSALHPRFEYAQKETCVPVLVERVNTLCTYAAEQDIALTIDAEEADRLELTLEIFEQVLVHLPKGWQKFGLAVQAYQKRAANVIDHMISLAQEHRRRIPVRLVKGAYWDSEIKHAQVEGLQDFAVFTRKCNTDLSYLACAQKMMKARDFLYPMFGTHNAHTIAAILEMAGADRKGFEFQRLFGMGESLYGVLQGQIDVNVTIYAPVGAHQDLLPYLVRRLLENGANSSFVNKLYDPDIPAEELVTDPVRQTKLSPTRRHPHISLPADLYGAGRKNSRGLDLNDPQAVLPLIDSIAQHKEEIALKDIQDSSSQDIDRAFAAAKKVFPSWNATPAATRAAILNKIADLYEDRRAALIAHLVKEGYKTLPDALAEVREAIDFCRYYAQQGTEMFDENGVRLPGPTGEDNRLIIEGRGIFVCISPWNFPLAIFTGQVVAALMAGNTMLAKPAEQTPHIARYAVNLMHDAGIPREVLYLIRGDGKIGTELVYHDDLAGVAFTGSVEVAHKINRTLAAKDGAIAKLIAETGGQNAMIVDSSALPERVIDDVLHSAFGSAGQRCSAQRVLFVQNDIADNVINMLKGAMAELVVGPPGKLSTDVAPVIDGEAHNNLVQHKKYLDGVGKKIAEAPFNPARINDNFYFAPCAYEIDSLDLLDSENFGPILHVIRYEAKDLDNIIRQINESGYGLTFGLHSRIESRAKDIARQIGAGNIYINRGMTGAVVGTQPFGGRGLSGTGPKAGGPHYLQAFANEKVISIDTTASGGNASLVSLEE
jgi:RHH-type proline utilization regulon transcriptional repressor/proline dehydrogenase/delta 1-pyrroline-5-carboxylate dehydrogenase